MSYNLFDFENDIKLENLIIGKQLNFENNNKYYIYYLDSKPKDIYIKLPPTRLIYNYKNNKFNQIKLPIYPLWEKNKQFISKIKSIEKYIQNKFKTDNVFVSCLDKKEKITSLKLNLNLDFKIKIGRNINLNIKDLKVNGEVEGIISIPYIWEKNEKYGLSINIYQLKYIAPLDENELDFYDKKLNEENINDETIYYINQVPEQIKYNKIPEQIKYNKPSNELVISPKLLQETLNKLKKRIQE